MSDNSSNGRYPGFNKNGSNGAMGDELSPEQLAHIWEIRAQELAKPPPAQISGETLDLITFRLNGERYGVEIDYVREVYPLVRITPVPRTPAFVAGVLSVRGRVISVVDLCTFFGLPGVDVSDESKIVVVTTNDGSQQESDCMEVGLLTDEVEGTLTIHEADLEPALATRIDDQAEFTLGIAPGMLLVLDLNVLLNSQRIVVNDELS
jgi:purine-binding chemotaxis protein CheW